MRRYQILKESPLPEPVPSMACVTKFITVSWFELSRFEIENHTNRRMVDIFTNIQGKAHLCWANALIKTPPTLKPLPKLLPSTKIRWIERPTNRAIPIHPTECIQFHSLFWLNKTTRRMHYVSDNYLLVGNSRRTISRTWRASWGASACLPAKNISRWWRSAREANLITILKFLCLLLDGNTF